MNERVCRCGGLRFQYVGVQSFPIPPYFLRLYNCLDCLTTIAEKIPKGELGAKGAVLETIVEEKDPQRIVSHLLD
jgi:hypothetical protein